jgi:hypothetical protein
MSDACAKVAIRGSGPIWNTVPQELDSGLNVAQSTSLPLVCRQQCELLELQASMLASADALKVSSTNIDNIADGSSDLSWLHACDETKNLHASSCKHQPILGGLVWLSHRLQIDWAHKPPPRRRRLSHCRSLTTAISSHSYC